MERYNQNQKKSIYEFIKNRNFGKYDQLIPEKILDFQFHNDEQNQLKKLINKLQKKILEDTNETIDILKETEYFLPLGNNSKSMNYLLFNTRNFLDIIECLNSCRPRHILNLLNFIEKMLKHNSNISKYISNNKSFLRLILKLMQDKVK